MRPALPVPSGDTLLFAIGLFVATDKIHVFPAARPSALVLSLVLMVVAALLGNVAGSRSVARPVNRCASTTAGS